MNATNQRKDSSNSRTKRFPEPVTHGVGVSLHVSDISLYKRVERLADKLEVRPNSATEPVPVVEYEPPFLNESSGCFLLLNASNWKAGKIADNGYQPQAEYHLTLKRRIKANGGVEWKTAPISLDIRLRPYLTGLTYEDGNPLSLPFGPGTHLHVQTTYPEGPQNVIDRVATALYAVDGYDLVDYDPQQARLTKIEAYHRIESDLMGQTVECLENTKELICYGRDVDLSFRQERAKQGWVMAQVRSDKWNRLGFGSVDWSESLKLYRASDWDRRSDKDPLRAPKLEAAYDGGASPHPRLADWGSVLTRLQHIVVQHLLWAGIGWSNLVADPYYEGIGAPLQSYPYIDGRREDLRARYERLEYPLIRELGKPNQTTLDFISIMLEAGGATYEQLVDGTGLAYSTIRYHAGKLENLGVVERVGNPVVVVFPALYIERIVRETVNKYAPDTVSGRKQKRRQRAANRQERRNAVEHIELPKGATRYTATIIDVTPEAGKAPE